MKNIYTRVRELIYSNCKHNHWFATSSGGQAYSAALCEVLIKFEQKNRGHRDLLHHPDLSVSASARHLTNGGPRRLDTIRNTLANSLFELFQRIVHNPNLPDTPEMANLLQAKDTLGYISAFFTYELKSYAETLAFTTTAAVIDLKLRVELGANPVILHVNVKTSAGNARRRVPLCSGNLDTLGGAHVMLEEACRKLDELLADVSAWPELTPVEVQLPVREEVAVAEPLPTMPTADSEEVMFIDIPDPEELLLARLKRDLAGFLEVYSPETRAVFAKHWASLGPIV